jgi:hypothetical protein
VIAVETSAALADLLTWPEASDPAPEWLLPSQASSYRRGLAAVRRYGGVLLADPVGSGKTYVALAIASRFAAPARAQVVAPAVLTGQWQRAADRVEVAIEITSHERVSRGQAIGLDGPVIIDESHRFRNPSTRRYRRLAPLLIGRPTILVSATPVVNRLADLANQLLLAVRGDALRFHGVPSLGALDRRRPPLAIGRLVVRAEPDSGAIPDRNEHRLASPLSEDRWFARSLDGLDRLRLSSDRGIAALVRASLYRALASSPAAVLASVRRYRLLLEHATSAKRASRRVSRKELWRAAGVLPEQLVMWELFESSDDPCDLAPSDRPRLATLERILQGWVDAGDRKSELLRAVVRDRAPTLVFTAAIDTVAYLRRRLAIPGVAWITGDRAGFGAIRAPRETVLGAFAPNERARVDRPDAPWLLLATDVAAEGLDLQRVSRVIHYDLPWTAVRLEQRDGRALRRGSSHRAVAVVRFDPPPELETRLELSARVERKAELPVRLGLAAEVDRGWGVSHRLRRRFERVERARGAVAVESAAPFAIAGFEIAAGPERFGVVLSDAGDGQWTDDPIVAEWLLDRAARLPAGPLDQARLDVLLESLRPALDRIRGRLQGAAWFESDQSASRAIRRVRDLASDACRSRATGLLDRCDRALGFLQRGHSRGEEAVVQALARGDLTALDRAVRLGHRADPDLQLDRIGVIAALELPR